MAKKKKGGGAVLLLYCIIGGLSESLHPIFCIKFVLETFQNNNLVKFEIGNTENSTLDADFKRLFLGIHKKKGSIFGA